MTDNKIMGYFVAVILIVLAVVMIVKLAAVGVTEVATAGDEVNATGDTVVNATNTSQVLSHTPYAGVSLFASDGILVLAFVFVFFLAGFMIMKKMQRGKK